MKRIIVLLIAKLFVLQFAYSQRNLDSLVALMTTEEKISFISGYENFNIKGLELLGIPQIKMADGPMGVKGHGKATAFPASICMAATWNTELIEKMATVIAKEAKSKGIGVLLAPGVNIYRVPHCGRNFEYYGEDPYLVSKLAVAFIKGVQNENVMATVKHFVANNQDYDRHRISSEIDERTLQEIYFPAFRAAVRDASVGAVMTSYNPLNGIHTSESSYLINEVLKNDWDFNGIVISDWISVYSTDAFAAGLDLEMPRPQFMNKNNVFKLLDSIDNADKILDDKVKRIISTCQKLGLYKQNNQIDSINWDEHDRISKQVAREGIVLLKNKNNILPFAASKKSKILVLGPNALYTPYSGGGAAMIDAYKMTSYLEGIRGQSPENYKVDYVPIEGMYKLFSELNYTKFTEQLKTAKDYDAVVLCLGFDSKTEGEGFDRPFALPKEQEALIDEVSKLNNNVVAVVNSGGGVHMPWLDKVAALLYTWYPGQTGGEALGEIIFGKVNPSGKLPISIEKQWKDNAAFEYYDTSFAVPDAKPFYTLYGKPHDMEQMIYGEGIFTGYRHYDKKNVEPLFPFGFGLSYTSFKMDNLSLDEETLQAGDSLQLTLRVKNTGMHNGAEVIQLYIRDIASEYPRPVKELKAFKKVFLEAGDAHVLDFYVTKEMLEFYNPNLQKWVVENGEFEILIGSSSKNIILKHKFQYKE